MTSTRHAAAGALSAATLAIALAACAAPDARPAATIRPGPGPGLRPSPSGDAPPRVAAPASAAPDPNAPEVVEAGDIPDNQVFVPYSPPGGGFTVSVPEGWSRTDDHGATVFTDKFNSVRLESVARPAGHPTSRPRGPQELPAIASSAPGFVPGDVTAVNRAGGPAVLHHLHRDVAGRPGHRQGGRHRRGALRVLAGRPGGRADPGRGQGRGQRRSLADGQRLVPVAGMSAGGRQVSSLHRFFRAGDEETLALQGVTFSAWTPASSSP